ncbi:MAG: hypothetical protein R3321_04145 [Nitrososphaeraceae archaeon]|nr:hypothetical protein [Nitrososphaeraceae archaeon]
MKVWVIEESNIIYEFHKLRMICTNKELAKIKRKEFIERDLEIIPNEWKNLRSEYPIEEVELNKEVVGK